jgi:ankyrin repeat domain-containing protein 50
MAKGIKSWFGRLKKEPVGRPPNQNVTTGTSHSSAPDPQAQPTTVAAALEAAAAPSDEDDDPWSRAFKIVQSREPDLMREYQTHLGYVESDTKATGTNPANIVDLSTSRSVESVLKKLLKERKEKQWAISLKGIKPVNVRELGEKFVKFLLWTDPIVQQAVSAQPYAALAWTGVSVLLPVSNFFFLD